MHLFVAVVEAHAPQAKEANAHLIVALVQTVRGEICMTINKMLQNGFKHHTQFQPGMTNHNNPESPQSIHKPKHHIKVI